MQICLKGVNKLFNVQLSGAHIFPGDLSPTSSSSTASVPSGAGTGFDTLDTTLKGAKRFHIIITSFNKSYSITEGVNVIFK